MDIRTSREDNHMKCLLQIQSSIIITTNVGYHTIQMSVLLAC